MLYLAVLVCIQGCLVTSQNYSKESTLKMKAAKRYQENQRKIFPCKRIYSPRQSNQTVHTLRPQDIGIIGAVGDSLTSGVGAKARSILEILDENRGVSFMTGGDGDWSVNPTIANFIRVFNPHLKGSSYGSTQVVEIPFKRSEGGDRGLNLSRSGSTAEDLPEMARKLVKQVRKIRGWQHEWKLVSILIGHNDLCSYSCNNIFSLFGLLYNADSFSPAAHRSNVEKALRILWRRLPRTVVLLLGVVDVTLLAQLRNRPVTCQIANLYECPCMYEKTGLGNVQRLKWLAEKYREEQRNLAESGRFDRDDFTVLYLPTLSAELPTEMMTDSKIPVNLKLLAPDCFHFMENLHGLVARNLWNNLLQEPGNRTVDYRLNGQLLCPTQRRPFLSTK